MEDWKFSPVSSALLDELQVPVHTPSYYECGRKTVVKLYYSASQ